MTFTMILYEFMKLFITSILSILFFIIFNAIVIYDEEGFDYRGYNCYGKDVNGNSDKRNWKYFIFQKDILENITDKDDEYIYYYNPFFDNLPSHMMIFLIVSINNVILLNFFN